MSQHAIENLIEDTVYLIDKTTLPDAGKRDCLAGIYRIQAYYDTSDTQGRVQDILDKYGFIESDTVNIPALVHTLMLEAEKQGDTTLLTHWYGLLVNGYLDSTLEINNPFENEDLLAIRTIAQRNNVKRIRGTDDDIILPVLKDEVQSAGGLEREYNIRFFLDLKHTPEKLRTNYTKAVAAKDAGAGLLAELITAPAGWTKVPDVWCWYKDTPNGRRLLQIIYEEADKFLVAQLGLEHPLILKWQQREADTVMHHVHFNQMVTASKKYEAAYGGWKFDPAKPKKTLEATVAQMLIDIEQEEAAYFDTIQLEFPDPYFTRNAEELIDADVYLLFGSPYAILLSFAYYKKEAAYVHAVRQRMESKTRRNAYETQYLEPFLQEFDKVQFKAAMPPVYHSLLVRALM